MTLPEATRKWPKTGYSIAVVNRDMNWWCWLGLHRWDTPGGHCDECNACDQIFEEHHHGGLE